jgi:hypothetical protein
MKTKILTWVTLRSFQALTCDNFRVYSVRRAHTLTSSKNVVNRPLSQRVSGVLLAQWGWS